MFINIKNYNISFQGNKYKQPSVAKSNNYTAEIIPSLPYRNNLAATLKSTPNSDFAEKLKKVPDIASLPLAQTRIASLSRYLKEEMVGFVVPEYKLGGEKKGGYQWFEKSAEYLLRGCKFHAKETDFQPMAKSLYGLLSLHDNYWKSNEFLDYLSTLESTPAIQATKQAVKELQRTETISFGYNSALKSIGRLLEKGCAYSEVQLTNESGASRDKFASVDHLTPKCWGGPCEDYNYILCSSKTNNSRGSIGLLDFLKGHNSKKYSE
ncbi:MAG: hypothetical protein WC197_06255 [Candidatus Gastranaerophilaceae bacterium]|jgi:hypothetical protein